MLPPMQRRNGRAIETERFVSWGEFYLPDAGWIPFDPDSLRTKSLGTQNVRQPWTDFGTVRKLNERIHAHTPEGQPNRRPISAF